MKKFFFRLETLLRVRTMREKNMQREFESAKQKWDQLHAKEKTIKSQIHLLSEEMRQTRCEGKIKLQETYSQILDHLNKTLAQMQTNLQAQQRQIEEQKERLKQAVQERKVIEKIKEKHYAGWRARDFLAEGALLDEIALKKTNDPN